MPGAITDKVALITSVVLCDALLIGSISSQLYNPRKADDETNFIFRTWGFLQVKSAR